MPPLPKPIPDHKITDADRRRGRGPANRLARSLTNDIIRSGNHPVAVMLDNMTFWHTEAGAIRELIHRLMKTARTVAERDRLISLLEAYGPARDKSEQCAKDLAPYIHPKLASISVIPEAGDQPTDSLTDEQLAEIAARAGAFLAKNQNSKMIDITPTKDE